MYARISGDFTMQPKITFSIPTYNAASDLPNCLSSIRNQNYPKDKIEILIADGDSEDDTVEIAKKFGAQVYHNEKRLADYGAKKIAKYATGDLLVIFAADNELGSDDWVQKVATIFTEHKDIAAIWGRIVSGKDDPAINKYYALIQSDPFFFFMNQNLKAYLRRTSVEEIMGGECYFFKVEKERPLVWGANGLTYDFHLVKDIILRDEFIADNDVFQIVIENGHNRVAYMPSLETVHHTVESLSEWVSKWRRNFTKTFLGKMESRNLNWAFTKDFKRKLALWLIYSLVPAFSFTDAVYKAVKDRSLYWMYHPLVAFAQSAVYIYLTLGTKSGRTMIHNVLKRGKLSQIEGA